MEMEIKVFETLNGQIHAAIDTLIKERFNEIIDSITPVVITGVSLYIVIYAYMIMAGRIQEPFSDFMVKCAKIILISTCAINSSFYGSYIYDVINGLQLGLSSIISGNSDTGSTVYSALDNLVFRLMGYTHILAAKLSKFDIIDIALINIYMLILAGILLSTGMIILTAATIITISDIILQLLIAVGPIFIACLLFPATQRFFEAWFNQTITMVLKISFVLFTATIGIELYLMFFEKIQFGEEFFNSLIAVAELVAIAFILSKVISESSSIASSLGNGMAIGGNGVTGKDVMKTISNVLQKIPHPKAQAAGKGLDMVAGGKTGGGSTPAYQRAFLNKLK